MGQSPAEHSKRSCVGWEAVFGVAVAKTSSYVSSPKGQPASLSAIGQKLAISNQRISKVTRRQSQDWRRFAFVSKPDERAEKQVANA